MCLFLKEYPKPNVSIKYQILKILTMGGEIKWNMLSLTHAFIENRVMNVLKSFIFVIKMIWFFSSKTHILQLDNEFELLASSLHAVSHLIFTSNLVSLFCLQTFETLQKDRRVVLY